MMTSLYLTLLLSFLCNPLRSLSAYTQPVMTHKSLEENKKSLIDRKHLPIHIGIIMDGNGRWAVKQGKERLYGHQNALESIREAIKGCVELGIQYLTLYAFSTENWRRPKKEVEGILALIPTHLDKELADLVKNDIKLRAIGDLEKLPQPCQEALHKAIETTKHNKGLQLTIAVNYGGRAEIVTATKAIVQDVQAGVITPDAITNELFETYLYTKEIPDPALLIRTSGEMRLSNFLLWQSSYTELYFTKELWPDFRKEHLYEAIIAYQKRIRRFGQLLAYS